jgi:phosphohistidine phosphatase SixA
MRAGSFTAGTLMKQLRRCSTLIQAPDKVNARSMIGKRESPGPAEHCMKTLFLIRHAKSSWDDIALPDKDRSLNDRGRRDAPKMGKRLAKRDVTPDLTLSSPARRALTTAEIIAKKLDYKLKDIVVDDRLYAGAADDLLKVIQKLGDKLESVMLFGHTLLIVHGLLLVVQHLKKWGIRHRMQLTLRSERRIKS